ncbi:hypothetical protein G3N95_29875 [Paraburkholderia sp. Tr-20389]|uniref:PASTA domain-containing protein n=1 Tax=Paraburkholderia sp. Tr-20389 TaxID=2703903 RepID=UPI00197E656E|nr:PASTA domain-containing protein [Paraburkholderia sp. Tr-20389]MBN3757184.1 hypothetical protein [Paraburkholderia sp. Tr-20389]
MANESVVGMTKEKAIAKLKRQGLSVRISREEGKSFMVTADMRWDRMNLVIEGGKVIKASIG